MIILEVEEADVEVRVVDDEGVGDSTVVVEYDLEAQGCMR